MQNYRVKSGDTLGAIAARYKTSVAELARDNKIRNANVIEVGQVIKIESAAVAAAQVKAASAPKPPPVPAATLKRGSEGTAVKQLQSALVRLGHMSAASVKTGPGLYGPRTEAGVRHFQKAAKVPVSGVYGPQTRVALQRALAKKPPTKPAPAKPTRPATPSTKTFPKPKVIKATSPNQDSRGGKDIDTIVLHHTASNNGKNDLSWLRNPKAQVSAHYLLDRDGKIYQLVGDERRAWHAGTSALHGKPTDVNARSLGIEIVNDGSGRTPFTSAQYKALGQLVGHLKRKYNVPAKNILGHKDVAIPRGRKSDPASNFDWRRLRASI